jgi:hypothetical protein
VKKTKAQLRKDFNKEVDIFFETALWLLQNKKALKELEVFDYPSYGGMPPKIYNQLSSVLVDTIQDNWEQILAARSIRAMTKAIMPLAL